MVKIIGVIHASSVLGMNQNVKGPGIDHLGPKQMGQR